MGEIKSTGKPLSETKKGLALATLGGVIGGPVGLITSPVVLLILRKYWKPSQGKVPNRFLAWSLIGIAGAPISAIILSIPIAKQANDQAISNCNSGNIEACKELLNSNTGIKEKITNPDFKDLLTKEAEKKKDALEAKMKAEAEAIETKQLLEAEKERQRNWKEFKEWGESPKPWIGCKSELKSLLLDSDSYKDDYGWASKGPKALLQADGYKAILRWRFKSKNTFGGYAVAFARCESSYDWDKSGYGRPVVTVKN